MSAYALHPEALADIDAIWEYIAGDSLDAADLMREAKREIRHSQQTAVAAMAAADGRAEPSRGEFANLVARLRSLGQPRTLADRDALEELITLATSLLEPERRRRARRTG